MPKFPILAATVGALALTAAAASAQPSRGRPIDVDMVPQAAVAAAKTVLGPNISEARVMSDNGAKVYMLSTTDATGKSHSIDVSADGKVLTQETPE